MTMLLIGLLTALGLGLTMMSTVETWLSAGLRTSQELSYAADAAVARVQVDLAASSDWTSLLTAAQTAPPSAFNDGIRLVTLADATVVDLDAETRALQTATDDRCGSRAVNPNCPEWRLFAHAPIGGIVPGRLVNLPVYVAAWIADDPTDADGDAASDSNGRLLIRAAAFGPRGARRSVDALVGRAGSAAQMLSWRELR